MILWGKIFPILAIAISMSLTILVYSFNAKATELSLLRKAQSLIKSIADS